MRSVWWVGWVIVVKGNHGGMLKGVLKEGGEVGVIDRCLGWVG